MGTNTAVACLSLTHRINGHKHSRCLCSSNTRSSHCETDHGGAYYNDGILAMKTTFENFLTRRKLSNAVFVVTVAAVLIYSVLEGGACLPVPVDSMGKRIDLLCKSYEASLKDQRYAIKSMVAGTSPEKTQRVLVLAHRLELRSNSSGAGHISSLKKTLWGSGMKIQHCE